MEMRSRNSLQRTIIPATAGLNEVHELNTTPDRPKRVRLRCHEIVEGDGDSIRCG